MMEAKTEVVTADRIAKLANTPGNAVYAYTYDEPVERMDAEEQAIVIRQIVCAFDAGTVAYPHACDEALRERILSSGPRVRAFQRLHPRVFAEITVRVHTDEAVKVLDSKRKMAGYMIMERARGKGSEEDKAGRIMTKSLQMALKEKDEGAGADADADAAAAATTTVDLGSKLDPATLRNAYAALEAAKAMDMGECCVRQPFTLKNGA